MSVAVTSGIGAPNFVGFEWHVAQFLPMIACTSQGRSEETGVLEVPPLEADPLEGGCEPWPPVVAGGANGLPPVPKTVGARPPVAVGFEGTPGEPPVFVATPQLQVPTPEPVGLHKATPDFPSAQVQAT
jgi:hypothetical protein